MSDDPFAEVRTLRACVKCGVRIVGWRDRCRGCERLGAPERADAVLAVEDDPDAPPPPKEDEE